MIKSTSKEMFRGMLRLVERITYANGNQVKRVLKPGSVQAMHIEFTSAEQRQSF